MMKQYMLKFLFPGLGMIMLAFWAGSQENFTLGLLGFLPFFVIGVVLIFEGRKKVFHGSGPEGKQGKK